MLPRLFASLPAALLILGLHTACTRSNEEPPMPAPSASYELDGQARTCTATQATSTSSGYDFLTINLTTTPQPTSGLEILSITLRKPAGQPTSAYEYTPVGSMLLQTAGLSQPYPITHKAPLPTFTASGISGTFSGEVLVIVSSGTAAALHTLKAGTYANVQP